MTQAYFSRILEVRGLKSNVRGITFLPQLAGDNLFPSFLVSGGAQTPWLAAPSSVFRHITPPLVLWPHVLFLMFAVLFLSYKNPRHYTGPSWVTQRELLTSWGGSQLEVYI